jgi:poly(3-hydroxybutyrate) depolymerase
MLPTVSGTCPTIATGTPTFAGEPVQIWAGTPTASQHGSLVLFWFETGGSSSDAAIQFGTTQINAVTAAGGIVASFAKSNGMGTNTGDGVWYTGDFTTADQVVACAIQQFHIDPRKIYVTGASAGALQTTWMAYARSGYVAAAATISGGLTGFNGFYEDPTTAPQDPSNVVPAMAIHGAEGVDVVGIDFAVASAAWESDIAMKGGHSVDCNTGGGHVSGPPAVSPGIWQFFQDHPFKVSPNPYPPLPSVFPSYCQIGPRGADGGAP